jgi:hypothetical protein
VKDFCMSSTGQLTLGLAIVAAVFVAFAIGSDAGQGAISAAIALAFLLVVHVGRNRSDTLGVMSGIGDERAKLLYTHSVAVAGTVMSFVLPGWWLVTVALGDPTRPSACCARSSRSPSSARSSSSRGAREAAPARGRFVAAGATPGVRSPCSTSAARRRHAPVSAR